MQVICRFLSWVCDVLPSCLMFPSHAFTRFREASGKAAPTWSFSTNYFSLSNFRESKINSKHLDSKNTSGYVRCTKECFQGSYLAFVSYSYFVRSSGEAEISGLLLQARKRGPRMTETRIWKVGKSMKINSFFTLPSGIFWYPLASFDTFWLPIWTWLGVSNASSTKRYGAVQIRQKSTAVANMKPVSDFCRTCWLMLSHGSGRIDEEVENLYSAWELLSAEAGRLFPCSVSIFKIFWRPKLVRVRYCLNCVK